MKVIYSKSDKIDPKELLSLDEAVGCLPYRNIRNTKKAILGSSFIATARINRKLIGIIRLITDGGYIIHVADMAIHPHFQRKGIGSKLLKMAISYANKLKIGTGKNLGEFSLFANTGAVDFYLNSNFSLCPNGMVLTDDPIRKEFERNFQAKWIRRHQT